MGSSRPVRLDLESYVPYFFSSINNALSRGASRLYLREFGVGIGEWRLMALLAIEPGIAPSRFCQVINMDKAAVSRSLRMLEQLGFVATVASSEPRRRAYTLTAQGEAFHDKIILVALQREERLLDGIPPEDRAALVRSLRRMLANLASVNRDDYRLPPRAG